MLGKQIRFDISILRNNPIKYFVLFIQITLICLSGLYTYNNQKMYFLVIDLVMIFIMILFMLNISTVFENHSLEFTVNKLAFYPTTKVINLISKAILLIMFVIIQIILNCIVVYIGSLATGNEFNSQTFILFSNCALVSGIFCFVMIWGMRTLRSVIFMSCFSIPLFFIGFGGSAFLKFDMVEVIILSIIFIFDFVVNMFNYIRS